MKSKRRIYLDFASATPIDKDVLKIMTKVSGCFANPASLYTEGRETKKLIDSSRKTMADLMRAHTDEIVFTSGGTESNNLALFGVADYFSNFVRTSDNLKKLHIIVSSIEHSSVLETAKKLEAQGVDVSYVKPDKDGIINPSDIRDELRDNTVLVSVMYANNEIGTIEPITEIAKVIRHYLNENKKYYKRREKISVELFLINVRVYLYNRRCRCLYFGGCNSLFFSLFCLCGSLFGSYIRFYLIIVFFHQFAYLSTRIV